MLQAGSIGLMGLGMHHLRGLRAAEASSRKPSVIYIFLSGGLAQHESFDLKPDAPDSIRGEFKPIATKTTGIQISEHLPKLAQRSNRWALVRSLTHPTNNHSDGHLFMLTGRSKLPPGFNASKPMPSDWPSIAAIVQNCTKPRNNLPPAAVLPDRIVHNTGRVIPGQFAGEMGEQRNPWFIEASAFAPRAYGAFPAFEFDHQEREMPPKRKAFQIPNLELPEGLDPKRLGNRLKMLDNLESQCKTLEAEGETFDKQRQAAVSLLTSPKVRHALDVSKDRKAVERYGDHSFGWSLLMARRLVEAGVNLVQVNLGNNETWDTHGNAFPHLKNQLFPPTDHSLSALLDDLHESGLLENTLIVMAGEFGRTPKISTLTQHYKGPGRDHWGSVQTVFFAGGRVKGGTVIGSSDKTGGYPAMAPQTPENMAATIYDHLGIPSSAMWTDATNRPHHIYHGEPISGLTG